MLSLSKHEGCTDSGAASPFDRLRVRGIGACTKVEVLMLAERRWR
jgi:hypothetical protein